MKFKVLTLFPEMVQRGLSESIIGRAAENNLIELETVNIRDHTKDRHGKVDDYTYGGGAGMLMQAQPVYDAWRAAAGEGRPRTIYVTPQGKLFTQDYAKDLAGEEELIFLCGHYEGIDQRVLDEVVTDYISIGDYVLTGGELPAMVMIDAISRLVPGVLHNEESAEMESFHRHLLEYPQYSRPEEWMGKKVPEVLLSGDHRKISAWRRERSEELTSGRRPDLYAKYLEQETLIKRLSGEKRLCIHMMENLRRGAGEIIFVDEHIAILYDESCKLGMFHSFDDDLSKFDGSIIDAMMSQGMKYAVTTSPKWNGLLGKKVSFEVVGEYRQACYTQKNPLHVRHKDIRLLTKEHSDYVTAHCDCPETIKERMEAKALFGVFSEDKLVGFAGWHPDGSLGSLYVDKEYRRCGIGSSLEAFCINRQLEAGYVPYGYVLASAEPVLEMQEQLGLYLSDKSIWRLAAAEC